MPPLERSPEKEENLEKESEKKPLIEPVATLVGSNEAPSVVVSVLPDTQEVAPKFEEAPGSKLAAALQQQQAEMDANETTSSNHSDAGVVVANKPSHLTENVSSEECDSVELQTPSGTIATATTAEQLHDGLPSIGSAGHFAGECKRCCFHPKGRCSNGYDCRFCHFDHDKRKRSKKPITPTGPGDMQSMQPNMGQPMGMMPQAQAPPCFMPPCMAAPLATVPADMTQMDPMQAHMRGPDEAAMQWGNEMQMTMPMPGMPGLAPWQQAPQMFPPVNHPPPFGFNQPMWPQPCGPGPCVPPMMEGHGLVLPRYTSNAGCLMPEAPLGTIPVNSAPVLTMPNQMPPNPLAPQNLLLPPAGPMPGAPLPLPEPLPPGAVPAGPMLAQGPSAPGAPIPPGTQPTGPQATPLATSPAAEGKAPNTPAPEKKGNDSPRSVILKLTGAWNALATGKGHDLPMEPGADFEDMRAMCVPPAR